MEFFLRTVLEKTHLSCDLISPCSSLSKTIWAVLFISHFKRFIAKKDWGSLFSTTVEQQKGNTGVFLLLLLQGGLGSWAGSELRGEPSPAHSCMFLLLSCSCSAPSAGKTEIPSVLPNLLLLCISHYKKNQKNKKSFPNCVQILCYASKISAVSCLHLSCCGIIFMWLEGFFLTNKKNTSQRQQLMEIAEALECFCGGESQIFSSLTENDVRYCTCLSWWVSFHS